MILITVASSSTSPGASPAFSMVDSESSNPSKTRNASSKLRTRGHQDQAPRRSYRRVCHHDPGGPRRAERLICARARRERTTSRSAPIETGRRPRHRA